jgi:hypothetical protein
MERASNELLIVCTNYDPGICQKRPQTNHENSLPVRLTAAETQIGLLQNENQIGVYTCEAVLLKYLRLRVPHPVTMVFALWDNAVVM